MPNQITLPITSQALLQSNLQQNVKPVVAETVATQQVNQNPAVIQVGAFPAVGGILAMIIAVGIAYGTIKTLVAGIKRTLEDKVEPELKDLRERIIKVEVKVDSLWKDKYAPSHSPRQLNDRGKDVLEGSGIKEIVDKNKEKLLDIVKKKNVANPYDAEAAIFEVIMELPKHCPEMIDQLKTGAFKTGADLGAVLFVGGIYLRDIIFEDLGFKLDDLDRPMKQE